VSRHRGRSWKVLPVDTAVLLYQEYFLGERGAAAWGWQPYHHHVRTVMKSGSLKLLEPSGSLINLYGNCFSFYFTFTNHQDSFTKKTIANEDAFIWRLESSGLNDSWRLDGPDCLTLKMKALKSFEMQETLTQNPRTWIFRTRHEKLKHRWVNSRTKNYVLLTDILSIKKVKLSRYRPEQTYSVPGG
jgi:hypothetical protein